MSNRNKKYKAAKNWQAYYKAQKSPRKRPKPFTYRKRRFCNYQPLNRQIYKKYPDFSDPYKRK